MDKASVIISIYNKIDFLELVLAGFEKQSFMDFEIILADDGSSLNSCNKIEEISNNTSLRLIHIWQEDKVFRKNKILNRAIVSAKAEVLIFVDGDCIPHPEFVKEHIENLKEKSCNTGRRVNLSEKFTSMLSSEKIKNGFIEKNFLLLVKDGLLGKSFDVEKGLYFRNKFIRDLFNKKKRGLLGCNFSIHKKDLLEINGFDERYEAPSIGEDSDIQYRLELNNIRINSLNNIAVQYHLYHKLQERPQKNLDLFASVKLTETIFTPFGIQNNSTNS